MILGTDDHDYAACTPYSLSLSEYCDNAIEYTAGFVSKQLRDKLKCEYCIPALGSDIAPAKEGITSEHKK